MKEFAGRHNLMRMLAVVVIFVMALAVVITPVAVGQQRQSGRRTTEGIEVRKPKNPFGRPPVSRPVRPAMGGISRYQTDRVFLERADSLYRLPFETVERQILKGDVRFRQAGMWMYCDSAYYFPEQNSLDAFGNVRMRQGDTISVDADRLYYDGDTRLARLRCGPSRRKVVMRDGIVTLTTDSLDYDLGMELGWYDCGGELNDRTNTLTSVFGQYSPATKDAEFYHDVVLHNMTDGYTMLTDTMYYNTGTKIARIESPTEIQSENDTILTSNGWYDTGIDMAQLTTRSTIIHRDSTGAVTTLEGDSIIYDKATRVSRAYSYRGDGKLSRPTIVTDTANKATLIGGYGLYDGISRMAEAADYPLLMEYSRTDTLFLRADTIRMYIDTVCIDTPDSAGIAETSLPDFAGTESEIVIAGDTVSADTVAADMSVGSARKEYRVAQAYRRARFFRHDMQGVADSIVFTERDSLLRLYTKPVVWSGERQVSGPLIFVHISDSTVDYAILPDGGMMVEHVEDEFYNQLSGKNMKAFFEESNLKRLEVDGNVETIFLPLEQDSTYNRIINAESSFMTIDMDGREIDKLKMWPEVSGTVTPVFLAKPAETYLRGFRWLGTIRPAREWYGDRIRWADDLGEIPAELEEYFSEAVSRSPSAKTSAGTQMSAALSDGVSGDDRPMSSDTADDKGVVEKKERM